jgi:hypothetical protein
MLPHIDEIFFAIRGERGVDVPIPGQLEVDSVPCPGLILGHILGAS